MAKKQVIKVQPEKVEQKEEPKNEPEVQPEKVEQKVAVAVDNAFEKWYAGWLQKVDITKTHHPEAHGCLGQSPQCKLCDISMPDARTICSEK